ncbi:MATE family efflux transporter [Gynuella sp.]|uniref:MATE family efflux transporter n=1 Tax=Gynuella sp. TaxID=2969146 RepID=UPI003D143069
MSAHSARLGTAPIGRLFASLSMPIILGLLVGGLYNVVDALFIARGVNSLAIGGVSIVFPIQMAIFAVAGLIGSGTASIVTRRLGAKDEKGAQEVTGNALFLALVCGLLLTLLIQVFMAPLLHLLGVTSQLWGYSVAYLVPIVWGTTIVMLLSCLNDLARAEGKMHYLMFSILLSSILNIILDPVAIYVLHWGVVGVALATVLSQAITVLMMLWLFLSGRTHLKIKLTTFKLDHSISKNIFLLGLPIFFSNVGVSVVIGMVNATLSRSGLAETDYIISAYGIVARIFMFLFFPLVGMVISYQTICSYNYGARQFDRVRAISSLAVIVVTLYTTLCTLLMVFLPEHILHLFTSDPQLLKQGVFIARYVFLGFFVMGAASIWTAYFQAIGKAKPALFLSSFRVYLLHLPLLLVTPALLGVNAIWFTYPIASLGTFLVSWMFIRIGYRELRELESEAV